MQSAGRIDGSRDGLSLCQSCGACCAYSRDWPRFTTEDDSDLLLIPRELADLDIGRMRCSGERCSALVGEVGVATSCAVYALRPVVCRDCVPGDDACRLARDRVGLPAIV